MTVPPWAGSVAALADLATRIVFEAGDTGCKLANPLVSVCFICVPDAMWTIGETEVGAVVVAVARKV